MVRADQLQKDLECVSGEIYTQYHSATPEQKIELRCRLADAIHAADEASNTADALFAEILRDLQFVPHDKTIRARMKTVIAPLQGAEGIRTPEMQQAMNAVQTQLEVLLKVSAETPPEHTLLSSRI